MPLSVLQPPHPVGDQVKWPVIPWVPRLLLTSAGPHGRHEASLVGGWPPWPSLVRGQGDLFPASEFQIVFPFRGLVE